MLLASACAAAAVALPASPEAWRKAAQADIEAGVQVTRENHPGMHDQENPGFARNLEAARLHGLALAAQVRDAAGYLAAVQGFNTRIGDGHAGMAVQLDAAALPRSRWPGFVTVWRGNALYVHSSAEGQLAPGSKLIGCDGKSAEQLIRDNVFAFQGRVAEAGQWWLAARRVFIDAHNPFVALLQRCRFEWQGKTVEQALAWRALDAQAERWLDESPVGVPGPVGVAEPRKNLYWFSMPTFHPDEAGREAYRNMFRELAQNRQRYLAADAIVVDLRGNRGGSSSWSRQFAEALFGKRRVTDAVNAYGAATEVWWRASPGNTEYVASLAELLTSQQRPEEAAWARAQAEGMRAALARGAPFHVEKGGADSVEASVVDGPAFTRPVYVIVPGNCASACLDAIDVFSRFPNTILAGAPSSADSTYMDVRRVDLASGLAFVIIPNKVYVKRGRANGQIYRPHLPVHELVWSSEVLLKAVEADLARR